MGKDYYSTLNVSRGASSAQIAANFRLMALSTHPDKN